MLKVKMGDAFAKILAKPRLKYKNKPIVVDNIRFDSRLECSYYLYLKRLLEAKKIMYFLVHVPFRLKEGIKYECDFMVVHLDNRIEWIDVKGQLTQLYLAKKKLVEETYPIKIKEVRSGDF